MAVRSTALLTQNKLLLLSFLLFLNVRVPAQACLLDCHLLTFTTRLIVYYVYALVLFI